MWLLPILSLISGLALRVYYRLRISGSGVPKAGPVLLVANHPNSLLDPGKVAAAARRPVRFLAKAPLFEDPKTSWLVKAAGAIPVYRKTDDPNLVGQNVDTFRAVFEELAGGAAVGLFPEGISHSEPSLAELRTGAARIALGTYPHTGKAFPIIPVGLVPERKERFRSEMLIVVGEAIEWADLAACGQEDREAVRELTRRIEAGLRRVTLNLEVWEDRSLVEYAEVIWTAHFEASDDPSHRIARLENVTRILKQVRTEEDEEGVGLIRRLSTHVGRLRRLGLGPKDLQTDTRFRIAVSWAGRRFYLVGVPLLLVGLVGYLLFFIPLSITKFATRLANVDRDAASTWGLLLGVPIYSAWIVVVALLVWLVTGRIAIGAVTLTALPFIGLIGRRVRERWRNAQQDARRFLTLRSRRSLAEDLLRSQERLAEGLDALYRRWEESRV